MPVCVSRWIICVIGNTDIGKSRRICHWRNTRFRSPCSASFEPPPDESRPCRARTKVTSSRSPTLPVPSGSMLLTSVLRCTRLISPGKSMPQNISSRSSVLHGLATLGNSPRMRIRGGAERASTHQHDVQLRMQVFFAPSCKGSVTRHFTMFTNNKCRLYCNNSR